MGEIGDLDEDSAGAMWDQQGMGGPLDMGMMAVFADYSVLKGDTPNLIY